MNGLFPGDLANCILDLLMNDSTCLNGLFLGDLSIF